MLTVRSMLAIRQPVTMDPSSCSNTIACLRKNPRQNRAKSETELDVAGLYGCPLFAHCLLAGKLDDSKLAVFAKWLVLSNKNHEKDLAACYSVLGSHLHMGVILSSEAVSSLVSSGACLASFSAPQLEGEMYPCTRS